MKLKIILKLGFLMISISLNAQKLNDNNLIGKWKIVKKLNLDHPEANKIIQDNIENGTISDTLHFKANKTYVWSYGQPYISTGRWYISGNQIRTNNSRFEPAQTNAILYSNLKFENIHLKNDTLIMKGISETETVNYYIKLK